MVFENIRDKFHRYFWYRGKELLEFIGVCLIFAFMLSFSDWGDATVIGRSGAVFEGLKNFLISFIVVIFSLFLHNGIQRWYSLHRGYIPSAFVWWPGIIIGLVLTVFSNGKFLLFYGPSLMIAHSKFHRLGTFRWGWNVKLFGQITALGLVASAFLAGFSYSFLSVVSGDFLTYIFSQLVLFNIIFTIINLLPLPYLDGSRVFYAGRFLYVFVVSSIFTFLFFRFILQTFSIIIPLFSGALAVFAYYVFFERTLK